MDSKAKADIVKYLNDLLTFREIKHHEMMEFNNFNKEEDDLYVSKNDEIKSYIRMLEEGNDDVEFNALKSKYAYLLADFDNYKKRIAKEKSDAIQFANKNIIINMLSIVDDFERVLSLPVEQSNSTIEGIRLIYSNVINMLKDEGCEKIDANVGDVFDVNFHEAIGTMDAEDGNVDAQTIVKIMQSGWMLNGKLLRPTKVVVTL